MFVGQTRFSMYIPGTGAWRASDGSAFDSPERYKEHLYAESRLSVRSDIFFGSSLPLLARAARDHDVRHIVSFSESLPDRYRDKLAAAAARYDFLYLDERGDGEQPMDPIEVVRRGLLGEEVIYAEYRLDDDDLLSTDYFRLLSPYVVASEVGRYVSFAKGLTGVYEQGTFTDVRVCRQPMVAIGLARICRLLSDGRVEQPAKTRHTVADTVAPVILDSRKIAYFWSRHVEQDTAVVYASASDGRHVRDHLSRATSGFPPVTDWSEVYEQFPEDLVRLRQDGQNRKSILHPVERRFRISAEAVHFGLPDLTRLVHFEVHIRSSLPKGSRGVRMVLDLVDAGGQRAYVAAWPESPADLTPVLVNRDGRRCWAVPLRTSAGLASTSGELRLPDGVLLRGVTIEPADPRFKSGYLERFTVSPQA